MNDSLIYTAAETRVFWDFGDFPVPDGGDLSMFPHNIRKALEDEFFRGRVSLRAYGAFRSPDEECLFRSFSEIHIVHGATDKLERHSKMVVDMVDWALDQPTSQHDKGPQANLIVIAKDIPEKDSVLAEVLQRLMDMYYNVFLVVSDEEQVRPRTKAHLHSIPLYLWRWGDLFRGEPPLDYDSDSVCDKQSSQAVKRQCDEESSQVAKSAKTG